MENNKAIAAYAENMETIMARLEAITDWCENMGYTPPESVNWGDVGSAGHVSERLSEIMEFLRVKEGE